MRTLALSTAFLLLVVLLAPSARAGDAAMLIGTWKLIAWEQTRVVDESRKVFADGKIDGRLVYDANGNMAVQYVFLERAKFNGNSIQEGTPDEIKAAFTSYGAYFGRYTVDEEKKEVTHHVEANLFPNSSGSIQKRTYELAGNKLTLKTPALALRSKDATVYVLVWEKLE
ncbi:MAG: lipocalin-like domain-containing protein [Burkholderiales bacterium]